MFIPLLIIITALSTSLHSMENDAVVEYRKQCQIIQNTLTAEKNEFLEMVSRKHLDPTQELNRIDQQFTYYRKKLKKEKMASLLQLKSCHNINDEDWEWCMRLADLIRNITNNGINSSSDAFHDPIISGENKMILAQQLHMHGLDLQKITIQENKKIHNNRIFLVNIFSSIEMEEKTSGILEVIVKKPKIIFPPQEIVSVPKGTLITTAWLFPNCGFNAGLEHAIIKKSNKNYSGSVEDLNELRHSNEFMHFVKVQLKESEISPSLAEYKASKWITKGRSYYHSCNTELQYEYFQQLCTIKNLWEKRIILEHIMQK